MGIGWGRVVLRVPKIRGYVQKLHRCVRGTIRNITELLRTFGKIITNAITYAIIGNSSQVSFE